MLPKAQSRVQLTDVGRGPVYSRRKHPNDGCAAGLHDI